MSGISFLYSHLNLYSTVSDIHVLYHPAQRFSPSKVIGVDIDGDLITAAWKRRRTIWSLQEPPRHASQAEAATAKHGQKRKRMNTDATLAVAKEGSPTYFPAALQHMFGPLPIPSSAQGAPVTNAFPSNVTFYAADWVAPHDADMSSGEVNPSAGIEREDREGYDVVVA